MVSDPGVQADVGDAVLASDELRLCQPPIQHLVQPPRLPLISADGIRKLVRDVAHKGVRLALHRADPAELEAEPLNDFVPPSRVRGHQRAAALGQVQHDRSALEHGEVVGAVVDDGGDPAVRVDLEVPGPAPGRAPPSG